MTKQEEARWVRDVALMYLGRFGQEATVEVESGFRPALEARFGSTRLQLTVPFRGGPMVSRASPRLASKAAALGVPIEYLLAIHCRGTKVASFRFRDLAGPVECLSFRAGAWRLRFIDTVARRMSFAKRAGQESRSADESTGALR